MFEKSSFHCLLNEILSRLPQFTIKKRLFSKIVFDALVRKRNTPEVNFYW